MGDRGRFQARVVGETADEAVGRNGEGANPGGRLWRRRAAPRSRTIMKERQALVGLAEEDAAGAGSAGEDAFPGRFIFEIGVGRDAADSDL